MGEKCHNCDKEMDYPWLTHCSDECLFEGIKNTESISNTPIENWDNNPWV